MSTANPAVVVEQDRSQGWVRVGYYLSILLPIGAYALLGHFKFIYGTSDHLWPNYLIVSLSLLLVFPLASGSLSVLGMLAYGSPRDRVPGLDWQWDPQVKLIIAYVSRGHQPATLKRASSESQDVLESLGVSYAIEVVTDTEIPLENRLSDRNGQIFYDAVPANYQTSKGARYKARALQYLLEQRTKRLNGREDADNVWILHLDEESIITPECVLGISEHITKYDLRRTPGAMGQGEILYNSYRYGDNTLVAAVDSQRTGGDVGMFRLQYKALRRPLVGMHGSYILTPARIEREITWDVGGHGSITEDAYFGLMAMQRGVQTDWVEGFIREQSPFTIKDIIRQRRRWFCGLSHVARDPSLHWWTTFTLKIFVFFWAVSALTQPLALLYLQQRFMFGNTDLPLWLFIAAALCSGLYAATYSMGAYRNVIHCEMPLLKKIWMVTSALIAWFFFIPALVECLGTLYGLFFPVSTFYVVAKDAE